MNIKTLSLLISSLFFVIGCDGGEYTPPTTYHNYSSDWSYNETSHWHACTDEGYENLKKDEANHTFRDVVTEPTYESGGYTTHTCTVCGYSYKDSETNKLVHNFSSYWTYDENYHWHACLDEGYSHLKKDKTEHTYVDTVVDPTYESNGYTTHTCTVCGYTYDDTETAQLIHNFKEEWTFDEKTHWHACTDEGYEDKVKGDETAHTFQNVVTKPTYEYGGYTTHTCVVCKYSYVDSETEPLVHSFVDGWSYDANYHWRVCTEEGHENTKWDKGAHYFTTTVTAPTYESGGYTTHTCTVCGYSYKDSETAQLEHKYSENWSTSKTSHWHACIDPGYTNLKKDLADHTFEYVIDKDATELETGEKHQECTVCGYKLNSETIPTTCTIDKLTFVKNDDDTYSVQAKSTSISGEVIIPHTYDGLPLVSLSADGFKGCYNVTSITIPDSVISIGDGAFDGCSSLTSVSIPDSVTSIGAGAFSECCYLESIVLPDGVTFIGASAFYYCLRLKTLIIPNSLTYIGSGAFNYCNNLQYNDYNGARYLGNETNKYVLLVKVTNMSIKTYEINETCKIIYDNALGGCGYLTSVSIPGSVISIQDGAFNNCHALTSVTIPDSVTLFGKEVFFNCTTLASVIIGNGITSISEHTFRQCKALASVTIGSSVTSIGERAFYDCRALESIDIPNTIISIGDSAFYWCIALTSIVIPDSVTTLGTCVFEQCTALESVTISNGVTSIGSSCFRNCSSLLSISIPDTVTSIGFFAFYECTSLASVNMGSGVTTIEEATFRGCTALTSITIGSSVATIESVAFADCTALETVIIPESVTSIHNSAFSSCSSLADTYFKVSSIENYMNIEGRTVIQGNVHLLDENDNEITEIIIPEGTTSIGNYEFQGCTSITSVIIPEGVTTIGQYAFSQCGITSVVLPDGVTTISSYAFTYSGLNSITIPNSVTYIGDSVFSNCGSLAVINFNGTFAEWNAIKKSTFWMNGSSLTTLECTDGTWSFI